MKYKLTNLARGALTQSAREYDTTFCWYETLVRIQFVSGRDHVSTSVDWNKQTCRLLINKYNIRLFRYGVGLLKINVMEN